MYLLHYQLLLTATFALTNCWTAVEQTDNSEEHLGHCFSKNSDVGAMENGEIKQIKSKCTEVRCAEGGIISYYGSKCPSIPRSYKNRASPEGSGRMASLKIFQDEKRAPDRRCGTVIAEAPCTLSVGDLSKPYPECCPEADKC